VHNFFKIYASGAIEQVQRMQVFSRWGALVFEAQNFSPYYSTAAWDGNFNQQPMPSGVYVYRFELLLKDGSTLSVNGDVTLIR
jgi:gliding motility-associated-like protein